MLQPYPNCDDQIFPIIEMLRTAKEQTHAEIGEAERRALRHLIFSTWELRHGSLESDCHPRSKAARIGKGLELVLDWPVPQRLLISRLLETPRVDLRGPYIQRLLYEWAGFIYVTVGEREILIERRLGESMPDEWDGLDRFARYKEAGIVIGEPPTSDRSVLRRAIAEAPYPFYIYLIRDPKGHVIYVGKGQGMRVMEHEREIYRPHLPVHTNWKKLNTLSRLIATGQDICYEIESWHHDEHEALLHEDRLIVKFEREDSRRLCNSDGNRWRGTPNRWLRRLREAEGLDSV